MAPCLYRRGLSFFLGGKTMKNNQTLIMVLQFLAVTFLGFQYYNLFVGLASGLIVTYLYGIASILLNSGVGLKK
jgi:hypothetical protein